MFTHYLIRILMVLTFLLAMADVWSTNRALANGGREANPVMAFLMRLLGEKWVLARLSFALFTIFTVMSNTVARESWTGVLSFGLNVALLTWVVWNNVKVGNPK